MLLKTKHNKYSNLNRYSSFMDMKKSVLSKLICSINAKFQQVILGTFQAASKIHLEGQKANNLDIRTEEE